jgi:hypothetical protein
MLFHTPSKRQLFPMFLSACWTKGVVIAGDIKVKLVDIELLSLQIRLVICSVDKVREMGMDWWVNNPVFSSHPQPDQLESAMTRIEERLAKLETALA